MDECVVSIAGHRDSSLALVLWILLCEVAYLVALLLV